LQIKPASGIQISALCGQPCGFKHLLWRLVHPDCGRPLLTLLTDRELLRIQPGIMEPAPAVPTPI
jgi:hypothetical protein